MAKKRKITTKKVTKGHYEVHFGKNNLIGKFIMDVDGFFYFSTENFGTWDAYALRLVADALDRKNAGWNKKIEEYFKKHK